ncbi:MAG: membrane protein insertase YidC [Clostridia bacterium]|nr:membrane protein insertase YidC [Clostridia bacterium]MBQ8717000.1 membrane protein insertase YidC [Clostridia bacterium]
MKQKKMIGRVLALGLCVLMLCVSLVACGGGGTEINSTWTAADADAEIYFSRILPQSAEAREKFVAASRGYNMSDPNFDDSKVELGVVLPVNVEAAKLALDIVAPKDDASVLKYNEFRNALTAEQVTEIVKRMAALNTVDLTEKTNPLVWIGKFLGLFGNYVFALFVFAIIVEILLLYFGIRQQKNSIKQAKLSPKERAIRKKYAGRNDQVSMRKMQEEVQKLYQEEGFNPMSGCLPLLIQMPIIIALYNIVIDPLRYVLGKAAGLSAALTTFATTSRAAGGLGETLAKSGKGTIELLSKLSPENLTHLSNFSYFSNSADCAKALEGVKVPDFSLFKLNMGLTPSFSPADKIQLWLLAIPVLTFVVYFISMKLNRKFSYQPAMQDAQMGCSNNMMDITMPLMSVYITFITPAAVGIYWIFKCIIGVVKQFILHKLMPLPTFTEEDYRKAEKEVKAKSKGKREPVVVSAASGQTYRSLHHIDDDDDLPPKGMVAAAVTKHDEEIEEAPATEQAPDDGRPVLKEDRKNKDKK